jgi:hypothetical protein
MRECFGRLQVRVTNRTKGPCTRRLPLYGRDPPTCSSFINRHHRLSAAGAGGTPAGRAAAECASWPSPCHRDQRHETPWHDTIEGGATGQAPNDGRKGGRGPPVMAVREWWVRTSQRQRAQRKGDPNVLQSSAARRSRTGPRRASRPWWMRARLGATELANQRAMLL